MGGSGLRVRRGRGPHLIDCAPLDHLHPATRRTLRTLAREPHHLPRGRRLRRALGAVAAGGPGARPVDAGGPWRRTLLPTGHLARRVQPGSRAGQGAGAVRANPGRRCFIRLCQGAAVPRARLLRGRCGHRPLAGVCIARGTSPSHPSGDPGSAITTARGGRPLGHHRQHRAPSRRQRRAVPRWSWAEATIRWGRHPARDQRTGPGYHRPRWIRDRAQRRGRGHASRTPRCWP